MKNPTPRSVAFLAALLITVAVFIAAYLADENFLLMWKTWAVVLCANFLFVFVLLLYLIRIFIYRKVKVIYKTISTAKDSTERTLNKLELGKDILGGVEKEVAEWEQNRSNEIMQLKRMETFRKEFLGNVSHELKTPLFSIQGYIHTLLDGGINDPDVNIQYLEKAAKSAERLCLIVEDLQEISKLESGELNLDVRVFDIHELVKEVFESLELESGKKGINLLFKDGSDKAVFVHADRERIRQVMVNLVTNSIKYGRSAGTTLVGFYDMEEKILVEITDKGIGIPAEHLPRIFERFYRVDKSRSREEGGTGLGLSIVKHIIEAHGQTINVRSTYGVGTTFTFTLTKAKS